MSETPATCPICGSKMFQGATRLVCGGFFPDICYLLSLERDLSAAQAEAERQQRHVGMAIESGTHELREQLASRDAVLAEAEKLMRQAAPAIAHAAEHSATFGQRQNWYALRDKISTFLTRRDAEQSGTNQVSKTE